MAIAGKILIVSGAVLLLFAIFIFLAALAPNSGWGPSGAGFGLFLSAFPGVPGACAFLLGFYLVRRVRTEQEFDEAMAWNKRSLRGTVCDATGAPFPKATIDVFGAGPQGNKPVATMRADANGRFSANLPEGEYELEVWGPEIGRSSVQVVISKSGKNAEQYIKV
jgi:hypothetical protein